MKSLLTVAMITLSAQAFAGNFFLESHYGKLSLVNGKYTCTLVNRTGSDLDLKRVEFNLARRAGKNPEVVVTKKVDSIVYTGETISVSSGVTAAFMGESCKFLAR